MSQLPRKWSTGLGVVFLLGMAATTVMPYGLAVSVMDRYDARQMLERTGVLLTLVIAIHVVACIVLAVLGFIAIKGRPVSAAFTLAIVCTPLMLGLILGRIEMGSAGAHALALSTDARPGEIAHALAFTAAPLLAGLFATVALLFAFCWSAVLAHLALHKKGVGGSVGVYAVLSWLPAVIALTGLVSSIVLMRQEPPHYSLPVWLAAVLLTLAVPFAVPASNGLKGYADRPAAEKAQRRLLIAVWTFPLAVLLLAFAHALQVLGEGLEQVQRGGGAAAVTQAELEISHAWPWVGINLLLALIVIAPLFFAGGTFRRVAAPDRLALIVIAVVTLGAVWFGQGRYALLGLAREPDPMAAQYAGIGLPKAAGNTQPGKGPTLRLDPSGELELDTGDGTLGPVEASRLAGAESVRLLLPAGTPFKKLNKALVELASAQPFVFKLIEQRQALSTGTPPLSMLAKAFEKQDSGLTALSFRVGVHREDPFAALHLEEPVSSALFVSERDHGYDVLVAPGPRGADLAEAEKWRVSDDFPESDEVRAIRSRLDDSPWVVALVGPSETAQDLATFADRFGARNAIELVVVPSE